MVFQKSKKTPTKELTHLNETWGWLATIKTILLEHYHNKTEEEIMCLPVDNIFTNLAIYHGIKEAEEAERKRAEEEAKQEAKVQAKLRAKPKRLR